MRSFQLSRIHRRSLLIALPLALCLVFLLPASSQAHAILLRSDPAKDAILTTAPSQVRMWFSEDLNPTFSTAVVLNGSNQHVDTGQVHFSPDDPTAMQVTLQPNLPPAVYVVVWRTQSAADGHVLNGSFLFKVALPDGSVPTLNGALPGQNVFGGNSTNANNGQLDGQTLFSLIMITLVELGAIFWVGAQLWRTFVLQLAEDESQEQQIIDQRAEQRIERIFSIPVLFGLLLANIGVLTGQGLSITGGRWDQVFTPTILGGLMTNGRFGTYWTLREVVLLLALAFSVYLLFSKQRPHFIDRATPWINLLLGLALLMALALSGHAAAVNENILVFAVLADLLHLLAASLWIGGMLYISLIYLPALKQSPSIEQTRSLLATLPRFSPIAISGVIMLSITGPFNAAVHMTSFAQLLGTAYGRALIVKVLLVGSMLLISAIHVLFLRPLLAKDYQKYSALRQKADADESAAAPVQEIKLREKLLAKQTARLSNVLRWEPALGVGVLVCTGLMAVFAGTLQPPAPPPQPQQPVVPSKPFSTTVKTTDNLFTVKLSVTPNSQGTNTFTATVLDNKGMPDTRVGVSFYTTMLDMDMGTNTVNLQPDGKGHFSSSGDLDMGGNWQIRIQIRTLDDTLHEARVKFFTPL